MKTIFATLAAAVLVGLVGCYSGTPGGPGADKDKVKDKDKVTLGDDTFALSPPTLSTKIKQGESKSVTIGIKRGKKFEEDVALKLEDLPKGVTADPSAPKIKHGDTDAKVTFKAADDAAVGEFTVKMVGHPGKGSDATNELKLTVEKK